MNTATLNLITFILVLLILLFLSFRLSQYLARRAICQVITKFRNNSAVSAPKAMMLQDMGLDFGFRFRILRDYRPWAFQTLVQSGVIRSSQDGLYYLSEEMAQSNLNVQCTIK